MRLNLFYTFQKSRGWGIDLDKKYYEPKYYLLKIANFYISLIYQQQNQSDIPLKQTLKKFKNYVSGFYTFNT